VSADILIASDIFFNGSIWFLHQADKSSTNRGHLK
jgi:hypothetical protein